ncbi:MAG: peptide-methionine (S)-S-oxide reductase [Myxococcota bacterium]
MSTRVGYAGGKQPTPSYREMSDHTEAIEIIYNPERISYASLLAVFWDDHSPVYEPWSTQYRSAIWPVDDEQRAIAEASLAAEQVRRGQKIWTAIEAPTTFTPAEDYHQKYRLRQNNRLEDELRSQFDSEEAFYRSTAAARLNGYLDGHGKKKQLRADLDDLNLTPDTAQYLVDTVGHTLW